MIKCFVVEITNPYDWEPPSTLVELVLDEVETYMQLSDSQPVGDWLEEMNGSGYVQVGEFDGTPIVQFMAVKMVDDVAE